MASQSSNSIQLHKPARSSAGAVTGTRVVQSSESEEVNIHRAIGRF
jgi:hypothetical protein